MAYYVKLKQFLAMPVKVGTLTQLEYGSPQVSGTAATTSINLPAGTTAERPVAPSLVLGALRYNTSISSLEYYDGSDWQALTYVPSTTPPSGNTTATITKDTFTTTTGETRYGPLDHTPIDINGLLVYMDNVIQEPTQNFTLSDSSGTLTGTLNYIKFDSPGTLDGKRLVVIQGLDSLI